MTPEADAQELAVRFEEANARLLEFVLGPARPAWGDLTTSEGWPVGVTCRHLGLWQQRFLGWVHAIRAHEPIVVGDLHQTNARDAEAGLVLDPDEVAQLIGSSGAALLGALRELTVEDLSGQADFGGQLSSVADVLEIFVSHINQHLLSMQSVVAGPPPV